MASCMKVFNLFRSFAGRSLFFIVIWLAVTQMPFETPAIADDGAEIMIRKGVELRRRGKDKEAAVLFRQAYDVSHTPRAAAQLGLCEQALEQWLNAEQHISEALLAESDAWVSGKRSTLETSRVVVRKHLASIRVQGDPEGAIVTLNERVLGPLPLPEEAWVLPGPQVVSLRKDGYEAQTQNASVRAGEQKTLVFALKQPVLTTQPLPSAVETASPNDLHENALPTAAPTSTWRPYAMWTAFGLSAASLSFAVWNHLQRESNVSKFNDSKGDCYKEAGQVLGGPNCNALDSKIGSATTRLLVGYVSAAVLSGIGVALLATNPSAGSEPTACGIFPTFGDQVASKAAGFMQCSGSF